MPAGVKAALLTLGATPVGPLCYENPGNRYFTGDGDGISEPLLDLTSLSRPGLDLSIIIYVPPPKVPQEDVIKIIRGPPPLPPRPPEPPQPGNTTVITVLKPSNGTLSINLSLPRMLTSNLSQYP